MADQNRPCENSSMPASRRITNRPVTPDTRTVPLHDAISRQAEKLWKRYGCPQGRDDEIWREAERQVLGADAEANQQGSGAVPAAPLGDVLYPPVQPERRSESSDGTPDGRMAAPGADTGLPK
jgi:hypothetical protein